MNGQSGKYALRLAIFSIVRVSYLNGLCLSTRTCRTPYGVTGWFNLLVTAIALLVFMLSAFHCFLTVKKTDDYKIFMGYWGAESTEIAEAAGRGNDNNYCVPWLDETKENEFDGAWRFGQALGIIGSIICIPFMILCFYILVYKVGTCVFTVAIGAHLSMAIITILLLVGMSSNVCTIYNCKMGPGGYFAILGFFLWICAAFFAFKLRSMSLDEREEDLSSPRPPAKKEKPLPALPPSDSLSQQV